MPPGEYRKNCVECENWIIPALYACGSRFRFVSKCSACNGEKKKGFMHTTFFSFFRSHRHRSSAAYFELTLHHLLSSLETKVDSVWHLWMISKLCINRKETWDRYNGTGLDGWNPRARYSNFYLSEAIDRKWNHKQLWRSNIMWWRYRFGTKSKRFTLFLFFFLLRFWNVHA